MFLNYLKHVKFQHFLRMHYLLFVLQYFACSLFRAIPEDNRRKEYQEAVAKARAEEEALASQQASKADESVSEVEGNKAPSEDTSPRVANQAQTSLENLLGRAKGLSDFSWGKFSAPTDRNSTEKEQRAQIATVRGQAKAKKLAPQRAFVKPQPKQSDTKSEVRPVFGGLFKQETVYVDDD
jgi:hypothetical protein